MTNTALTPLDGNKKLILGLVAASLCAMLAVSFAYRTMHPNLTEPGRTQSQAPAQQMPANANADELAHLMAMMQEDPNNLGVLKQITDLFIRQRDFERAGFFAQKALVAAPSDPQVLYMNGITLFNLNRPQEAVQVFETLIGIEDDPSARYNLGVIYKHFLNQPAKAVEHFKALAANEKADPDLRQRAEQELTTEHQ